jgi:hypothetical protein
MESGESSEMRSPESFNLAEEEDDSGGENFRREKT